MNTEMPCKSEIAQLEDELDVMMAVEVLEYNDKSHLSGSNESRNRTKRQQLERCMRLLDHIKKEMSLLRNPPQSLVCGINEASPVLKMESAKVRTSLEQTAKSSPDGVWVKIADRHPPHGKLVYTRSSTGLVGVYTLYLHGWHSKLSTDNDDIVEWLDQDIR